MTSVYFSNNNVICSEIVTSNIRTMVWMMSKSLNSALSITDGGPYPLMSVNFLNPLSIKPSFSPLSSLYTLRKHRSISQKPLANINWSELMNNNVNPEEGEFKNLDKYANNHIKNFWSQYNLVFSVEVEHKLSRTSLKLSYMNKAHYMMLTYNIKETSYSNKIFVIRGFHKDSEIEYQNPIYSLLEFILDNSPQNDKNFIIPNDLKYYEKSLLKISSWKNSFKIDNFYQYSSTYGVDKKPGDVIIIERQYRLYNTHCFIYVYKEFQKRSNKR